MRAIDVTKKPYWQSYRKVCNSIVLSVDQYWIVGANDRESLVRQNRSLSNEIQSLVHANKRISNQNDQLRSDIKTGVPDSARFEFDRARPLLKAARYAEAKDRLSSRIESAPPPSILTKLPRSQTDVRARYCPNSTSALDSHRWCLRRLPSTLLDRATSMIGERSIQRSLPSSFSLRPIREDVGQQEISSRVSRLASNASDVLHEIGLSLGASSSNASDIA